MYENLNFIETLLPHCDCYLSSIISFAVCLRKFCVEYKVWDFVLNTVKMEVHQSNINNFSLCQ